MLIETKLRTFNEIIGKTHGIKFKIKPPINAKIKACKNEILREFLVAFSISASIIKLSLSLIDNTPDKYSKDLRSSNFLILRR